jgi:hypothetical protein
VLDAPHQRGQAEDAVDIEHHRRVDGVAHQGRRRFVAHHDRQDHHFHQHGGQGQDHGAVGVADLFRQLLGMVSDAHRRHHDKANQRQAGQQRDHLPVMEHPVLQRVRGDGGDQRQQHEFFLLERGEHCGPFVRQISH